MGDLQETLTLFLTQEYHPMSIGWSAPDVTAKVSACMRHPWMWHLFYGIVFLKVGHRW